MSERNDRYVTAYKLGGKQALAELLRAESVMMCDCPECDGGRRPMPRILLQFENGTKSVQDGSFVCNVCDGWHEVRWVGTDRGSIALVPNRIKTVSL